MANLLIADDNEAMRQTTSDIFRSLGHNLFYAEEGAKIIEILQSQKIHLLLIDIELPGKEIGEMVKEIKEKSPQTSIVVMAGIGEDTKRIAALGVFSTLSKPFNVQEIRRIVSEGIQISLNPPTPPAQTEVSKNPELPAEKKLQKIGAKKIVFISLGAVFVSLLLGFSWLFFFKKTPVKIYPVSHSYLSGISAAGEKIWVCDWFNQSFYRHPLTPDFPAEKEVVQELLHPVALCWDGQNLWSYSGWELKLVKHKMDDSLSVEQEFPLSDFEPIALFSDGKQFWACDSKSKKLIEFEIKDQKINILKSIPSPGSKPIGVFKADKEFWSCDSGTGLIYLHDPSKDFKVVKKFALPLDLGTIDISCFTLHGKEFWIGSEKNKKIYLLTKKNLKAVQDAP